MATDLRLPSSRTLQPASTVPGTPSPASPGDRPPNDWPDPGRRRGRSGGPIIGVPPIPRGEAAVRGRATFFARTRQLTSQAWEGNPCPAPLRRTAPPCARSRDRPHGSSACSRSSSESWSRPWPRPRRRPTPHRIARPTTPSSSPPPRRCAPPPAPRPPAPPLRARPLRRPGGARDGDRRRPARQALRVRRRRPRGLRLLRSDVVRLPPRRLPRDAAHRRGAGRLRPAHPARTGCIAAT